MTGTRPSKSWWHLLFVLGAVVLIWALVGWWFGVPRYLLPTPWDTIGACWRERAKLASAAWITGREAGTALALGTLAAAILATAAARWRRLARWLLPLAILGQTVPLLVLAPLVQLWMGSGPAAVTTIAGLIGFVPVFVNATRGLLGTPRELIDLFVAYDATLWQTLWKLRWPYALPAFFTGLRLAAGLCVIGAITGELFAGAASNGVGGLGYSLSYASAQLRTDYLFALVGTSSALGLVFYAVAAACEQACVGRWHRPE